MNAPEHVSSSCHYVPFQMPSRCRNILNIVVTTLFAAVVLFTILLAYVTGE